MGLSRWAGALLFGGALAAIWWGERRRALRPRVEPAGRHDARNAALAATSAAAIEIAQRPVVDRLAALVERRGLGLVPLLERRLGLPRPARRLLAVLLLDYTLYAWHVLTHKVPLLWRFHRVHHADLDLTASTALRFHGGEMLLSVPWRAAQVLLIGVRPAELAFWQKATLLEIVFHHSNLRLPPALERAIGAVVVTPRMHGIHHSVVRDEMDSNWSSGLTAWDVLHGTLRRDVPQAALTIGIAGRQDPSAVTLPRMLALPLARGDA